MTGIRARIARSLQSHNGRLMLVGVGPLLKNQLEKTKIAQTIGRENIFIRTDKIGEGSTQAWDEAQKWLAEQEPLERSAELPDSDPPETTDRNTIRARVEKIGQSATQTWHNTQQWIAEQREGSAKKPSESEEPDGDIAG